MHPDHPLLARAQDALKQQLLSEQQRLQEELREKTIMLNVGLGLHSGLHVTPAVPFNRKGLLAFVV
jgi:hypothetical protein